MNGITIIEEHLCRALELPALIFFGIFVTLLIGGVLSLYMTMYKTTAVSKSSKIILIVCSIILIIMYAVFWVVQVNRYNNTHTEYTITIDDSVSFNDFNEKYEVISINGNEYRVVEK